MPTCTRGGGRNRVARLAASRFVVGLHEELVGRTALQVADAIRLSADVEDAVVLLPIVRWRPVMNIKTLKERRRQKREVSEM